MPPLMYPGSVGPSSLLGPVVTMVYSGPNSWSFQPNSSP
jgi:hypothetical protein